MKKNSNKRSRKAELLRAYLKQKTALTCSRFRYNKEPESSICSLFDVVNFKENDRKLLKNISNLKYYIKRTIKGRRVDVPSDQLKYCQRLLIPFLYTNLGRRSDQYAYMPDSSAGEFTAILLNKFGLIGCRTDPFIITKIDIANCFHSVKESVIRNVFTNLRWNSKEHKRFRLNEESVQLLTDLTSYNGYLPVGAPTSPYLINIIMRPLDVAIKKYLVKTMVAQSKLDSDISKAQISFTYGRYVDDIYILTKDYNKAIIPFIYSTLRRFSFEPNTKKTKIMRPNQRQEILGMVVTPAKNFTGPRMSRKYRRALRAQKHQLKLQQAKAAKGEGLLDYKNQNIKVIQGKEAYVKFLESLQRKQIYIKYGMEILDDSAANSWSWTGSIEISQGS